MRIALDIRPLQNESAGRGVGRYVRSLIAQLPRGPESYLYLESRWNAPSDLPPGAQGERLRLSRPARAITLFDQIATPLLCARKGIGLFHSTFYALPRFGRWSTRWLLTVHDLIPLILPGATGRKNTMIFRRIYRSARRADAVIVPSRRTRDDLSRLIGIPRDRIVVIPMGVGPPFVSRDRPQAAAGNPPAPEEIERVKSRGGRALVYAGGFNETKNVPFLLDALRELDRKDTTLFLVGEAGAAAAPLRRMADDRGVGERAIFLGRLSDDLLARAYEAADLFVSASRYEGFGLPPLEAMASGCPVVSLASASVPEVLDGAALVVQEARAADFAACIRRLLDDAALRLELKKRGLARAAELRWERTAQRTVELYRTLKGGSASGRGA